MDNIGAPPMSSTSFFTPLLISMLGIVVTAVAIATYHLILHQYCLERHQTTRGASRPPHAGRLATGVEEKTLETIPIIAYSAGKGQLFGVDQIECVVCLGELEDGELVRLLPNCRHPFHVECIDKWFMAHSSCPVCRSPLVAPMDDPATTVDGTSRVEIIPQNNDRGGDVVGDVDGPPSGGTLRHCASMVLPWERRPRCLVTGLKRSLSMDESFVIIEIERESERDCPSSSVKGDLMRSRSFRAISLRKLDRVSSKLLGSFSRLRMGRDSAILPY